MLRKAVLRAMQSCVCVQQWEQVKSRRSLGSCGDRPRVKAGGRAEATGNRGESEEK